MLALAVVVAAEAVAAAAAALLVAVPFCFHRKLAAALIVLSLRCRPRDGQQQSEFRFEIFPNCLCFKIRRIGPGVLAWTANDVPHIA